MNRKMSILLAIIALIASSLACAVGEPSLSNVRAAKDQEGDQVTAVFSTTDTVYVVSDLSNGTKGNVVSSKWYAVNVANTEPNLLLDEAEIPIEDDYFSGNIYFSFPPPLEGQWPEGQYKVEVFFNGALINSVDFSVQ